MMLPMGDAKGAALALMVEILAATLTGARYSYEASSFFDAEGAPPGVSHLIIAFDAGGRISPVFAARLEELLAENGAQQGARLPGSRRFSARADAHENGIVIPAHLMREILDAAGG
ncbi:MAG: Ldh family oxidoreductase [Nitratireductor sp.]|nr:Ldh family oxidoreductase [Nitratireductor sp.]